MAETMTGTMIDRERVIIRTSIIGIIGNVIIASFKAVVGLAAGSIAVILDAVNNLSDALSSLITIVGTKLAGKNPDKKHPLGYGRIEYLSALIVAALVFYAGMTSLTESVKKVINPQKPDYSVLSLVVIAAAVVVKLVMGMYVKKKGEQVNSGSLIASGKDALSDAVLSLSVFICALVFMLTDLSFEAYVGIIISVMIIKAGIEMITETVNEILGQREDGEFTKELKRVICEREEVMGAYDLIINNYGPQKRYASVHIELPDNLTTKDIDVISRSIQVNVFKKTGVILTGIGVYSGNTQDSAAKEMKQKVLEAIKEYDWVLQIHGFYVDEEAKDMRFDAVLSFDVDSKEAYTKLCNRVQEMFPDYTLTITTDVDTAD